MAFKMGFLKWILGIDKKVTSLNFFRKNKLLLLKIFAISKFKLNICYRIKENVDEKNLNVIHEKICEEIKIRRDLTPIFIHFLRELSIREEIKIHLKHLFSQYIINLNEQIAWFKNNQSLNDKKKNFGELSDLIIVQNSLMFDVVNNDLVVVKKELDKRIKLDVKLDKKMMEFKEDKHLLDELFLKIAFETNNFNDYNLTNDQHNRKKIKELTEDYKYLLADVEKQLRRYEKDDLKSNQINWFEHFISELKSKIQQIDQVLKDPIINMYSINLTNQEVFNIMGKLKPCHVVGKYSSMINILESGCLLADPGDPNTKERYMKIIKNQEHAIFFSVGGPYYHLKGDTFDYPCLIIFKKDLLDMASVFYPRDSGAYPDKIFDVAKNNLSDDQISEIRYLLSQRQFSNKNIMLKYLFYQIKHLKLRKYFMGTIVSNDILKENVSLFPEGIVEHKIPGDFFEKIIINVGKKFEFNRFVKKYGDKIIFVDDPLEYYWGYVGLSKELVD